MDITAVNGTYIRPSPESNMRYHDFAIDVPASVTGGTVTITGRKPGSSFFEAISAIDLASPSSLQFTGTVEEYKFVVTSIAGSGTLCFTDTVN
tara:strand:+ start:5101 stop:5379 length:279 start_codon:yes stop_codon:yes gene_type:complete